MRYIADLHTHSTASDGQHSPTELVGLAKEKGIEVLALTDHDTIDGIAKAEHLGKALGVRIIPGVELGAQEHKNLHILGYGFSGGAPNIARLCASKCEQRDIRNCRLIDFLHSKGLEITLEEVERRAAGAVIGRPHFAQVLKRKGYVSTVREAFDRYLDTKEYEQIREAKIPARVCIETIKADGGKVSLAHPYQLGYTDEVLTKLVGDLKDFGLDAIECYYPKHTPEQTAFYLELAKWFDLHITGGSDFHGEKVKPDIALAKVELELDWLL